MLAGFGSALRTIVIRARLSVKLACLRAGVVIPLQFTTDVPNIAALSKIAGSSECPDISFTSNRAS